MICGAASVVEQHKQQINELNVFPVPDGDTGTNMSMTLNAAAADLRKLHEPTLTKVADATASAMLRGARGNSGVILSLLFRGFSRSLKGLEECDGRQLAAALQAGVEAAYKAVMKPAEGTILTVARIAAEQAVEVDEPCFETVLTVAIDGATGALADTVEQNPVLKKAGVVDAGGKGWLYVLQTMLDVAQGKEIAEPTASSEVKEQADFNEFDTGDITFAFDTVYIVRKFEEDVDLTPLRRYLDTIGDSIVIGEDDEAFKVHVHTNIPGAALTESQKYGTLELAKIENMQMQHDDLAAGRAARSTDDLEQLEQELENAEPTVAAPEKHYGMVAVCAGEGLANAFRELGADNIISGGQTMNPSTQDILEKVNATPAEVVFVFPNNKNIIMAAEQVQPLTEKKVVVIPSKTVPQGISAMLVFDPDAGEDSNAAAMREAMKNVTTMQLTYAARDSDFDGHDIHAGEYLALNGGALFGNDTDMDALLRRMAENLNGAGKEFITIFYGADTNEEQAHNAAAIFSAACPDAEITVMNGGQPVYYFLISAE
ncbi:MAG: DAK2 domain-containing protein [Candidatus Faecousia sp.]|uniref:DAK2 domain-containing protein n=1 Tax=Faecousia sp. TaxID=2952921 RepID=UPI002A863323|nr:DAK2 domain-containing protein [Candidatus Faecousia sp.]